MPILRRPTSCAQRSRPSSIEGRESARSALGDHGHALSSRRSHRRRRPSFRRRLTLGATAAAVAGCAVVGVILLGEDSVGPGDQRAFAAAAVEAAESNPRLLITAPGWSVTRADELQFDSGSMQFSDGEQKLELYWNRVPDGYPHPSEPAPYLPEADQWYRFTIGCAGADGPIDCNTYERRSETSVLGRPTTLIDHQTFYPEREFASYHAMIHFENRVEIDLSGRQMPREDFLALVDSLRTTDVETWLSALPDHVVEPLERPEVVDEMLAGVPVPDSVDVEELKGEPAAASRYHLGAAVTGAVACGWLDQWANAIESGDEAAAAQATRAMSTSTEWPILIEMHEQGAWSETIWEYAQQMRRDERHALLGLAGTEGLTDGRVYELRPGYAVGLGCDSMQRILREEGTGPQPPDFPEPIPVPAPTP